MMMMAAPGEPRGCFSLRESRHFGNCLFLRHPWELGAVGKVHRATVGAEQTPELPPQVRRSHTLAEGKVEARLWGSALYLLRADLNL